MSLERPGWLAFGVGASLALHALVALWLARGPQPESPPPGARDEEAIEFQVVPTAGRETPRPPPPRLKRGSRGAGSPAQAAKGKASLPVQPASAPTQVELAAPSAEASPAPVPGAGGAVAEAAGTSGLPGSPGASGLTGAAGAALAGGGGDSSAAALLASRLSAAAQRCYPAAAVRFRLSGEVRLSFCLGGDGRASSVSLARSSGSEVLDRAASECVLPGALPFPGAAGCYELPVRFSVRAR